MKSKILKLLGFLLLVSSCFLLPASCYSSDLPSGFEVYFNTPTVTATDNSDTSHRLDLMFKKYLDAAHDTTIFACFYEIDIPVVVDTLNSALNRGCTVYVISDSSGTGATGTDQYKLLKTTCTKLGNSSAIMHNKFCVIKDSSVWTGSWNATENCTFKNNNNAIVIRSSGVASTYEKEFLYMYTNNKFGSGGRQFFILLFCHFNNCFGPYRTIQMTMQFNFGNYF